MQLGMLETSNGPTVVGRTPEGQLIDLCAVDRKIPGDLRELLEESDGLARAAGAMAEAWRKGPFVVGNLLAPIRRPGKVICIGLNYRDHARETGASIPAEPVVFNKFPEAVANPGQAIELPPVSTQVDFEAELVVVVGKTGKRIPQAKAWEHVAGYCIGNDVSARDWQKGKPGGQWLLGKTPDTFAPIGPYLVTADEVGDPHALSVTLKLNGIVMQAGNTADLIFGVDVLVAYVSQITTLRPGDLIFTGTPAGVGMARTPPVFLKPGDSVEVAIEGLGQLTNPVVAG